jgi:hypothetical protein
VRKYYSTGKNLSLDEWKKLANAKSKTLINIRLDIQNSFNKVKTGVQELETGNGFSFEALNIYLNKSLVDSLNTSFENKINELFDNNQIGSYIYYKDVLKSVEKFAGSKIQISSVTVDWLKRYEKYMLNLGG